MHELVPHLTVDAALFTGPPGAGFRAPGGQIVFDPARRMFMGHSQGAANGPLFMAGAQNIRGGGALGGEQPPDSQYPDPRREELLPGVKLRGLVELLLGSRSMCSTRRCICCRWAVRCRRTTPLRTSSTANAPAGR